MRLSIADPPYVIPTYSLTGDLLAYLKCGLQYRYHNKGTLPPSKPVQLWFGEFIHAVMEESYHRWNNNIAPHVFPWDWLQEIRPVELEIAHRLEARGIPPAYRSFCSYDGANNSRCTCPQSSSQNHKLIASLRADAAINTWGLHLFPLISEAEQRLQGIQPMPSTVQGRADYYEITGVADVIGSVQLSNAPRGNLILHYLNAQQEVQNVIAQLPENQYEIILDYKGTRRPSTRIYNTNSNSFDPNPSWEHFAWQVLTYAWLRGQQRGSATVVAGIVLFINELEPSQTDMEELQSDVRDQATDIMPFGQDLKLINNWRPGQPIPRLSTTFLEQRSIRIVAVDQNAITQSLQEFRNVVTDIENAVIQEMSGIGIRSSWQMRPSGNPYVAPERRTCTACDFKHYCPLAPQVGEGGPPSAP